LEFALLAILGKSSADRWFDGVAMDGRSRDTKTEWGLDQHSRLIFMSREE
jgi:hypothetical protein